MVRQACQGDRCEWDAEVGEEFDGLGQNEGHMDVNVRGMLELTMGVRLGRKVGHAHRWWGRERKGWGGCQRSPSHCTYSPCAESSGVSDEVRAHLGCGSGVSLFLRTLDLNSALLLLPHKKTSHLLNCFFSTDWGDPCFSQALPNTQRKTAGT